MSPKFQISRDSQALYITIVTKDRLPVFQSDAIKIVTCQALDEARKSGGFLLFAYVIMPDHLHLLTDCPKTSADVLRCVKGITARRVIDYLKEHDYQSSLAKLRHEEWKRKHSHSLWQQEKNVFSVFSEAVLMQKVNYIHLNPLRAGWSSGRSITAGRALGFGRSGQRMMNLWRLILIGSNGGGHSPFRF
jgi:REP element-mobilizing transposase RayT